MVGHADWPTGEMPEVAQLDGALADDAVRSTAQDLDCTSPSASSTMPMEDMREILTAVTQHSDLATALRQKGQAGRAVRTLERAVAMCAKAEQIHPAIAVEAARARVNLAAALSEAGGSVYLRRVATCRLPEGGSSSRSHRPHQEGPTWIRSNFGMGRTVW